MEFEICETFAHVIDIDGKGDVRDVNCDVVVATGVTCNAVDVGVGIEVIALVELGQVRLA